MNAGLWPINFKHKPNRSKRHAMASIETSIKNAAFKLRTAGERGIDRFSTEIAELAKTEVQDLLTKAGPEIANAYAETTLDAAKLAAKEAATGVHEPREWGQIRVQYAALNLQEAAILQAKTAKFLGSVIGILGSVAGELGAKWAETASKTALELFTTK